MFRIAGLGYVFQGDTTITFDIPIEISAKSDIDVRAVSVSAGSGISCNYDLMLIDDTHP